MRITGGKARGIQLTVPRGDGTRPATDQLREAVFSSLGPRIEGARIADLFAGTGAYGLEALSRGANSGLFVENNREAVACLKKNLSATMKSCKAPSDSWRVFTQKVETLPADVGPFDIVFIDPPYAMIEKCIPQLFDALIAHIIADNGMICFEMPGNLELELPGWEPIRRLGKKGRDKPTAAFYQKRDNHVHQSGSASATDLFSSRTP